MRNDQIAKDVLSGHAKTTDPRHDEIRTHNVTTVDVSDADRPSRPDGASDNLAARPQNRESKPTLGRAEPEVHTRLNSEDTSTEGLSSSSDAAIHDDQAVREEAGNSTSALVVIAPSASGVASAAEKVALDDAETLVRFAAENIES